MVPKEVQKSPAFFYGYTIVSAAFVIALVVEGLLFSFGVFFEPLLTEFGWTRAMASGAFSLYSVIRLPVVILAGRLTDRFGSRQVLSACGFFLGLGFLLMSQINAVWQLYLFYGVIVGIGMGLYWVPLMAIVPRWFVQRRALMLGIVASGIGVGQLIIPPTASWLISAYGWRISYLVLGAICMIITIISAQFLRQDPNQSGLAPYEKRNTQETSVLETRGLSASEAIRTRQFWLFCGIWLPWMFCLSVILVHIVIHATGLGMAPASAASIIAIIGITGIVGRLALGHLADLIGLKPVLILCLSLSSASFLWLLITGEAWMLYLFAAIFGIAYGTFEVLQSPIMAQLFGLGSFGSIFGIALAFSSIGFITGPVVAGHIFDITGSYQVAFIICAAMTFISLASAALLPITRAKGGE